MSEAPPFWFQKPGLAAWALSPVGMLYGAVTARRMMQDSGVISTIPVLCIGNFITGGAGKTPTAIAIAKIARDLGLRPGFLSRGYGGSITKPTVVDIKTHNAKDVGDEPLILGLYGITVVSADRPAGASILAEQGIDIIIMDDGFQNPSLHKDYSLAVVDATRGIGNGFCMPAGPLRAPLKPQLAQANAILLIGKSKAGTNVVRRAAKMAKPILEAQIVARHQKQWQEERVLAYAGIADPNKFYRSLESVGAVVVETRNFHDHHPFSTEECQELLAQANSQDLTLVTTEKDSVRLIRSGDIQQELRAASKVLTVDLHFENKKMVEVIIRDTLKRAAEYRLSKKS
ncbi:MAG: tetraacyldisaccharide 4'-kinase [Rhizobiaceae bacterium]